MFLEKKIFKWQNVKNRFYFTRVLREKIRPNLSGKANVNYTHIEQGQQII